MSTTKSWIAYLVISLQVIASKQCKINMAFNSVQPDGSLRERFPGLEPEAYMDARQLIESKGIPYEGHTVETKDGYLLGLQRLAQPESTQRYPVLIMHGLLSSSDSFLLNRRDQSLAYILYDRGFDVWLGNVRGTKYSRNHTSLDPESKEFWDWSFDEIGRYDVPAMIDYVLEVTGKSKLNYIGHSQGAMVLFSSVIQHQWWFHIQSQIGQKIDNFFALAPAVNTNHTWTESAKTHITELEDYVIRKTNEGHSEFAPALLSDFIISMCIGSLTRYLCPLQKFTDGSNDNFNSTRIPVYMLHEPSGTSNKNILHWIQMERRSGSTASSSMKFYDYGSQSENMNHYLSLQAPEYNLNRFFGVKTHIFCGAKDTLVTLNDCQGLAGLVHGVNNVTVVDGFGHIDFAYSTTANVKVYEQIINHMTPKVDCES